MPINTATTATMVPMTSGLIPSSSMSDEDADARESVSGESDSFDASSEDSFDESFSDSPLARIGLSDEVGPCLSVGRQSGP